MAGVQRGKHKEIADMENFFGADYLETVELPCYGGRAGKADCIEGGGQWVGGYCIPPFQIPQ